MSLASVIAWTQSAVGPGVTVIRAPSNGPAPSGTYIAISHLSESGDTRDAVEREADEEGVKISSQRHTRVTYSFDAFGSTGRDLLNDIILAANLPPVEDRPILADAGDIRDLAFLDDERFAPRWQCDLTFRESAYKEVIDYRLDSVVMSGEFSGDESGVTVEFEE